MTMTFREACEAVCAPGTRFEIEEIDVGGVHPASVTEGVGDPSELDVVINNAGFELAGALELVDDDLWTRQLDTNVLGPMRIARAVRFRESQSVLSGDGPSPDPRDVAAAIVRAALDADASFRNFVGNDAQLIHSVKSSMAFEEFETVMRDTLDWHE